MASELDRLGDEMAGLVSRIEAMERENRRENRTPNGLIVPKGVTVEKQNMVEIERQLGAIHRRLNGIDEIQKRLMAVLQRQQNTVEELSMLAAWSDEVDGPRPAFGA